MEMNIKQVKCPYCVYQFDLPLKQKSKCPNCGNFVFVNNEELITWEEFDIKNWTERLYITRVIFDTKRKKLSQEFGQTVSVNDTIWSILKDQSESDDLFARKVAFYEMVSLAILEEKDAQPYIKLALETTLIELKIRGVKEVEIVGSGERNGEPSICEKCREEIGKKLSIEDALKNMPIPMVCENPDGCRCTYRPINLEDV